MLLCLGRRHKISKSVKEVWHGNNLPKFRNNEDELKKVNKLVSSPFPTCSSKYFGPHAIRQHVLHSVQERRRMVKNGHNYAMVKNHICVHVVYS